ncbi:MAG: leucine-rich repeat domain-containing protein, partial [Ruminococcus sp.]|nr:leucine-rich repeat domain-containing protein [Ruminococcus sp.]
EVVIPSKVEIIGEYAFTGCTQLKDIIILSKDVKLADKCIGYSTLGEAFENITIHGYKGSTAETYALENGFTFIALNDETVEILDTGRCGENVYWTMYSDGTLDLSGTGATYDYTENKEHKDETDWCDEWGFPKWYDEYQNNIENIVVNEGITRLGDLIFCGSYGQIETINLPDSLEEVGYFALSPIGYIGDITSHKINRLPEKLKVIEDGGLFGIDFEEKVVLPENIEKIGSLAFNASSKEYVLNKNTKEISPLAFGVNYNEEYTTNDNESLRKFMEEAILKKNCDDILDMFVSDSDVTVYGYKNTVSETYALENGFTFIALDEESITTTTIISTSIETTTTTTITSTETDVTDTSETTTTSTETYVTDTSETTTTSTETDVTDTSETTPTSTETDITDR